MHMFMLQELPLLPIASLGVGGVLAGITMVFYAQNRRDSEKRLIDQGQSFCEASQASEKRFAKLAEDFRGIVERNTQAITTLTAMLGRGRPEDDR